MDEESMKKEKREVGDLYDFSTADTREYIFNRVNGKNLVDSTHNVTIYFVHGDAPEVVSIDGLDEVPLRDVAFYADMVVRLKKKFPELANVKF